MSGAQPHPPGPEAVDLGRRNVEALQSVRAPGGPPQGQPQFPLREEQRRALGRGHPAATVQTPQVTAATSSQTPLATPEQTKPETQGHPNPHQEQTNPGGPGPTKQPPGTSQYRTEHPDPDTEKYQCTSRWGQQSLAGNVSGGNRPPHLREPEMF